MPPRSPAHAERLQRGLGLPVSMPLVDRGEPLLEALTQFARAFATTAAASRAGHSETA